MSEYLPKDIRDQIAAAQIGGRRHRATRVVHIGDEAFAILEMTDRGFAVRAEGTPRLRGLIDIFEGPRHLYHALIVAASREGDLMRYDFKRNTQAVTEAPVDFERAEARPVALLSNA